MNTRQVTKLSFFLFGLFLFCVGYFKMATPLLTVLFSYFALTHFKIRNRKWIAICIFLVVVALVFSGFIYFMRHAVPSLPKIAEEAVPRMIAYAQQHGLELPFSDVASLKSLTVEAISDQIKGVARFAQVATEEFLFLIIGIVVAISLFLNHKLDLDKGNYKIENNLYSRLCAELVTRVRRFFQSFSTVMGAQIVISGINTCATSILVYSLKLPYPELIIVITFLCGLLPIIGNIISNTIICGIAITVSSKLAIGCLAFLIGIHKLEYFLNSKIIGGRIRNPMWLTLMALVVGERVMGIPGMILAPVLLNYLKLETSQIPVTSEESARPQG